MAESETTYQEIRNSKGGLIELRALKDGKVTGVVEYYDPKTNAIKQRVTFFENKRHGATLVYNKDGSVSRKLEFREGKLTGISEFYRDGNLYATVPFIDGKLNGIATYYDAGGSKRMEAPFANGILEGDMLLFSALGHIAKVIPHQAGKKQGIAKSYYPSGAILKTEPYLDNLLEGNVTQYYENGKVCAWHFYQRGKMMEGPRIFNQKSQELFTKF